MPTYCQNFDVLETPITYKCSKKTIEVVLSDISKNYKIKFTYINNQLPLTDTVSVYSNKINLSVFLKTIFRDTQIVFIPIKSQLLIKRQENRGYEPKRDSVLNLETKKDSILVLEIPIDKSNTETNTLKPQRIDHKEKIITIYYFSGKYKGIFFESNYKKSTEIIEHSDTLTDEKTISVKKRYRKINPKYYSYFEENKLWNSYLSVEIGGNTFKNNFKVIDDSTLKKKNEIEKSVIQPCFLISYYNKINRKLFWGIGFGISSLKYKGSYTKSLYFDDSNPPQQPLQIPQNAKTENLVLVHDTVINYWDRHTYLQTPVTVGYNVISKKIDLKIQASFVLLTQINSKSIFPDSVNRKYPIRYKNPPQNFPTPKINDKAYYYQKDLDPKNYSNSKFLTSLKLEIQIGYHISPKIEIFLSPSSVLFLNSPTDSQKQKNNPIVFQLNAGCNIKLSSLK